MYTHYRGTTFQFIGQMQNDGVVLDLTNATIIAAVYDQGGVNVIGNLTVQISDPVNGMVILLFPSGTGDWPVGKVRLECEITMGDGTNVASDPEYFRVAQSPIIG